MAFEVAAEAPFNAEREVRLRCRDIFRKTRLLERIIPTIEDVLQAGGIEPPPAAPEQIEPAIPLGKALGDDGHRR